MALVHAGHPASGEFPNRSRYLASKKMKKDQPESHDTYPDDKDADLQRYCQAANSEDMARMCLTFECFTVIFANLIEN